MASVDVVVPCYNYARFLPQCVESVLSQEQVSVRVLIIDDCSGDTSEATGKTLARQDRRVEYRRHDVNRGHIATFNEGLLEWASADYSLLLSADDALAPGALARAVEILERYPEVGMTCGRGQIVWGEDGCPESAEQTGNGYRIVSSTDFLHRCFATGNLVCTPTAVVRTALQQRLGGYRADLLHTGDLEMWMRFAVHSSVAVIESVQAYYRRHQQNMSRHYDGQIVGDRREVIRAGEQILGEWGKLFPEADSWRRVMLERMARESCWAAACALERGDAEGFRTCSASRCWP